MSHLSKTTSARTNMVASLRWSVTRAPGGKPSSRQGQWGTCGFQGCSSSDCTERRMGLLPALRASGSAWKSSPVTETSLWNIWGGMRHWGCVPARAALLLSASLQRGRGQKVVLSHWSWRHAAVVITWNLEVRLWVSSWTKCFLKWI